MPLHKRKPFSLLQRPDDLKPDELVFQIRFTKEIFRDYCEYLNRINLYRQRVWTCKSTGKSNLTYEEALFSEKQANEKIQQFPKELMEPVLRDVQFNEVFSAQKEVGSYYPDDADKHYDDMGFEVESYEPEDVESHITDMGFKVGSYYPDDADKHYDDMGFEVESYEPEDVESHITDMGFDMGFKVGSYYPDDADTHYDDMGFSEQRPEKLINFERMMKKMKQKTRAMDTADVPEEDVFLVKRIPPAELMSSMFELVNNSILGLDNGMHFSFKIPNLILTFSESLGYFVVKKNGFKKPNDEFDSIRMASIYVYLIELIFELLKGNTTMTQHAIYYCNRNLFWDKTTVSAALDDLCAALGCTRASLKIYSLSKGLVYGNLIFRIGNKNTDCSINAEMVPDENVVENLKVDRCSAHFILIVEKQSVFERIVRTTFCDLYKCIMVTGKGQPDVSTRLFVHKLRKSLCIPVLALVDCNPDGFNIMSTYKHGTKTSKAFGNDAMAVKDLTWIGVHPKDFENYNNFKGHSSKLKTRDISMCKNLLNEERVIKEVGWKEQLTFMLERNLKFDIEAFSRDNYLTNSYLPRKLLAYASS